MFGGKFVGLPKQVRVILLCALILIVSCCGAFAATESPERKPAIGTGGEGGVYYAYGQKLKELLGDKAGASGLAVQTTAGSASNLRLLKAGLINLGIVQNDTLREAVEGSGAFEKDGPSNKISAIAGVYTETIQVVVPAASRINNIADLVGKKVSVGAEESGSLENAQSVLMAYGMTLDDIQPVYLPFAASAKALANGEIEAFFCTAAAPVGAVADLAKLVNVKILPIDKRARDMMMKTHNGFSFATIPAGTYEGQTEEVETVGVKAVLVTNGKIDEGVVAAIISAIKDNADDFASVAGSTVARSSEFMTQDIDVPFHKTAVNYFKEQGIEVKTAAEEKAEQKAEVAEEIKENGRVLSLDMYQTMLLAIIALGVGTYLRNRIRPLATFCIPTPVIGGLLFAILSCVLYAAGILELKFDETLRNICMVTFFTSVGFQANMKVLKTGGKSLAVFVVAVLILIILQNVLATALSKVIGINSLIGLCTGSIPMVGGHGTAGAFGPLLEDMNIVGATTFATAAATYGLVCGSLMGGPLANNLILKKDLLKTAVPVDNKALEEIEEDEEDKKSSISFYASATYQLFIAMGFGTVVSMLLSKTGMTFPVYIGSMIVAAIIRNAAEYSGKFRVYIDEIDDLGGICLSLFLGVAMITLKLWQLAELALPLFILLVGQTVLMFIYARYVIFKVMGSNYDAAVLAAGTCGFGMGATPNAMANMQAVTNKFAPSVKAYIIVPIVGSMFADFLNSLTITAFINFLR